MRSMERKVYVTLEFEGLHKWKDAPKEVGFLRNLHRHLFKVRVEVEVFHNDREIEFILLKREIERFVGRKFKGKQVGSCEMIAEKILRFVKRKYGKNRKVEVEVSEDGENGAIVCG